MRSVLAAEASAALRDRLLTELEVIQSTDDAATWAHRSLPAKNTLTVADAQIVELGFRTKLAALDGGNLLEATQSLDVAEPAGPNLHDETAGVALPEQPTVGRGRAAEKTIRLRDKDHRKFVATQPCIVCGRTPADAHHLRFAQPRALGRKVSDEFTVPVCRLHHRELHRHGDRVRMVEDNQYRSAQGCAEAMARTVQWRGRGYQQRHQCHVLVKATQFLARMRSPIAAHKTTVDRASSQ